MKEKIYTIPINDAFDMDTECALCEFLKKEEQERIEYILGASMMEPDARIFTNENGFCQRHTSMLFKCENKLCLALVLKTHTDELIKSFDKVCTLSEEEGKKSVFSKGKAYPIDEMENIVSNRSKSCACCKSLEDITDKFVENILYLYEKEPDFKNKFNSSKGFCLNHYALLLTKAKKHMKGDSLKDFCVNLAKIQKENFERLSDEIDWFTKKFDYRYANEDWKTSRDAVLRGCEKIGSYINKD